MIKQSAYLYRNRQDLYSNLDPNQTGYYKMYARSLKLHKGIDNTIEFRLLTQDQKLLNAVDSTLFFLLLDRTTSELIFQKQYTIQGSDNSLVSFTVTEAELDPVNSGLYMYSTYLVDGIGNKSILYGDSQFNPTVAVEVLANSFPQIKTSETITDFFTSGQLNYPQPDNTRYTSAYYADPQKNSYNNAMHTCAIYSTGFAGAVTVQTTLENAIGDIVAWNDLFDIPITSDQSIVYRNFTGIFGFVRFHIKPSLSNSGSVDKILYRS